MISLLQLEYFRRLSVTQHITQKAKELFVSQTALISMIIGLEKELGVKLFDREGRSIKLNQAGEIYCKYVNEAFAALENGRRALQDYQNIGNHEVSLAVGSSLVWLPMIYEFRRTHPSYTVRQFNWSLEKLQSGLENMKVDFVIAGCGDLSTERLNWVEFRDDPVYLCVSRDHPLASCESVSMAELKDLPFIDVPEGSPWRKFCDTLFAQAGYPRKTVLECDYSLRASLIESNFGIALTSSTAREVDLLKPNCYIPISDSYAHRPMALFWNEKKYFTGAALEFRKFCLSYYQKHSAAEREQTVEALDRKHLFQDEQIDGKLSTDPSYDEA